jgi:2,3-dihydroxyphenylpropionate 1,2-dioxygenase
MPHYPPTKPELVPLITALHAIAHDPEARAAWHDDAAAFADRFKLSSAQREALIRLDVPAIVAMGAHPLVPFLANMQVERLRSAARK